MQQFAFDIRRDASNAIRGFVYQVEQTILSWLSLEDGQHLQLEAGEDIDEVIGVLERSTVQVKETDASITLTSVAPYIANFLAHQHGNPAWNLSMRFLTTSGIGAEQGNPFGKGKRGIALWNEAHCSAENGGTTEFLGSLLAFLRRLERTESYIESSWKALVMLVIACPCALVISTPVSVVSGLASAARRGILIKGGVYLEEGRKLRVVALDKTGTLTHGAPVVTDIVPLQGQSEDELLKLAASLDAPSEHPVASAIVAAWTGGDRTEAGSETPERQAVAQKGRELIPVSEFDSITGRGVKGRLDGKLYYLGNHRLGHEMGICSPEVEAALECLEAEAKTAVVLSDERGALGVLAVADTLRETSVQAVRELHELDVRTVMLTGDNSRTAKAIGSRVGIDDARGDLLPDDKLRIVDELLAEYTYVGMVGDGINDAPALAKSTVGFAMGAAGTDTAIETADVAIMQDDLRKLPEFIRLSRKTALILKQNIAVAIGIKAVFFVLALFGVATLWMAVFADMGASLLVVFNGLRLLRTER